MSGQFTVPEAVEDRTALLQRCGRRLRTGLLVVLVGPMVAAVALLVLPDALTELAVVVPVVGTAVVVAALLGVERLAAADGVAGWWKAAVALWVAYAAVEVLTRSLMAANAVNMDVPVAGGLPPEDGPVVDAPVAVLFTVFGLTLVGALLATCLLMVVASRSKSWIADTWRTSGRLVSWVVLPGYLLAAVAMLAEAAGYRIPLAASAALGMVIMLAVGVPPFHALLSSHRTAKHAGRTTPPSTASSRGHAPVPPEQRP